MKCWRCGKENPAEIHTCTPPLALILAEALDFKYADNGAGYTTEWTQGLQQAAAELRRLHAENEALLEALTLIANAENTALDLARCKGIARAAIDETRSKT